MPITLYRADSREPAAIETARGFLAFKPLDMEQARSLASRFFDASSQVQLPDAQTAPGLQKTLEASAGHTLSLLDMVRVAKAEKGRDTIHVSTDRTEECGGYATGSDGKGMPYLTYKMDVPIEQFHLFKKVDGKLAPIGCASTLPDDRDIGGLSPVLIMDTQDPRTATLVAIASRGNEITFLTPVPTEWITQYRRQDPREPTGFSEWQDMPHLALSRAAAASATTGVLDDGVPDRLQDSSVPRPIATDSVQTPNPPHPLSSQAYDCLMRQQQDSRLRFSDEQQHRNAADVLALTALRDGLTKIDSILVTSDGSRMAAVDGAVSDPASHRSASVSIHEAAMTPQEQTRGGLVSSTTDMQEERQQAVVQKSSGGFHQ